MRQRHTQSQRVSETLLQTHYKRGDRDRPRKILHCRVNVRRQKIKINQKMKSFPQGLIRTIWIHLAASAAAYHPSFPLLPALTYHLCNRMRPYRTVENQTRAETCCCYPEPALDPSKRSMGFRPPNNINIIFLEVCLQYSG